MKRTLRRIYRWRGWWLGLLCLGPAGVLLADPDTPNYVLPNLQAFAQRLPVGDPGITNVYVRQGPKGLATCDFDGDLRPDLAVANFDRTVTVYFNEGEGRFAPALHLHTFLDGAYVPLPGDAGLRGITCADFNSDGRPDIATAAPGAGEVYLFFNQGERRFGAATVLPAWVGARNLIHGDFDGDGYTDLAVGGPGLGVRQYCGQGDGTFIVATNLLELSVSNPSFPKPVYSFALLRPAGLGRDELVVTHADSERIWVLGADAEGRLAIQFVITNQVIGVVTNQELHSVKVGALLGPAEGSLPDLVTANRDLGTIQIRPGVAGPERFSSTVAQTIHIQGGPRALEIVDLDGDGWNDLVVVLRYFDCVRTYKNNHGVLIPANEMPVGRSPREIVTADFNGDGQPDAAVINRQTEDLSVLHGYPGEVGFVSTDQFYPACGEVSGLAVGDLNGDGRADVVQLHILMDDFSVRLAGVDGGLGEPRFFEVGPLPSALDLKDFNGDGHLDVATANLGRMGLQHGSVSLRLGRGDGTFDPEQRYDVPESVGGRLFGLEVEDFDGDGRMDLAVGFLDCRIAFYRGQPNHTLAFTTNHFFAYEARSMVAGDFDGDGDPDLAGASFIGQVVVLENHGDLLTTQDLDRKEYPSPVEGKFGLSMIEAMDVNGDGDLDLLVSGPGGSMLYLGMAGTDFELVSVRVQPPAVRDTLIWTAFNQLVGDFDGNGTIELLSGSVGGKWIMASQFQVDLDPVLLFETTVPTSSFLARGDVDGDGRPDVIGGGNGLWTALSSRPMQLAPPPGPTPDRAPITDHLVINEILAINNLLPLAQDEGRKSDWVEIYNGTATASLLDGWRLRLTRSLSAGVEVQEYLVPAGTLLPPHGHLVLVCSDRVRSPFHTGFRLPGDGGVLSLVEPEGSEIERVPFGVQQENVSYGRMRDGLRVFGFNIFPSPGYPNVDNGAIEPWMSLRGLDPATLKPGQPVRLFATADDDVGIMSLMAHYKTIGDPSEKPRTVVLFDDGMHEDGQMMDGLFSGLIEPGFPAGTQVELFLEAVDLTGAMATRPDESVFSTFPEPARLITFAVQPDIPTLEISELVAQNTTGLRDESGGTPDWVEIRNYGPQPVSLDGVGLGERFFGESDRYLFPLGLQLAQAESLVVFCDGQPDQGFFHAPFGLDQAGQELYLTGTLPNNVRTLLDWVRFGPVEPDVAWSRVAPRGLWRQSLPSPFQANLQAAWVGWDPQNPNTLILAFPTTAGGRHTVEAADTLVEPKWQVLQQVDGDGLEHALVQPVSGTQRYFRVRREP